jgi:hypothetical protein
MSSEVLPLHPLGRPSIFSRQGETGLNQCASTTRGNRPAKLSDGVVLVIEAGSTRRKAARAALENLRASGVEILAVILNKQK